MNKHLIYLIFLLLMFSCNESYYNEKNKKTIKSFRENNVCYNIDISNSTYHSYKTGETKHYLNIQVYSCEKIPYENIGQNDEGVFRPLANDIVSNLAETKLLNNTDSIRLEYYYTPETANCKRFTYWLDKTNSTIVFKNYEEDIVVPSN